MTTVTEQIIEVQVKGAGDIAKQLSAGTGKAGKSLLRDMEKVSKLLAQTFRKAPDEMLKSSGMKEFVKRFQKIQKGQIKAAEIVAKLEDENLSKAEKKRLGGALKRERKAIAVQQDLLKDEASALTKWGIRRKAIAQEAAKLHTRTLSDGIEGAFNKLKSGDLRGLTDSISKGVAGAGRGARKAGGKMGGPGAGTAMKAMGAAAVGLGAALAAVAAIAAAVTAVVAIFIALDGKVKDFNKSLIESQGAMGLTSKLGVEGGMEMKKTLDLVRKAAYDTGNNLRWMTLPKEQMTIIKAFGEANYEIKDMLKGLTSAAEKMKRLQDVTAVALTYSKLMGVSTEDIATGMGNIMFETSMGLDRVTEGFGKVARIAKDSGFNVKRFYSTVLEVTTGMGYYNMRMDEAAHLLANFTKMLGTGPGTEFFKGVKEGFDDMAYKERVKQIMVTGGKAVRKILDAESDKAASRFWKDFGNNESVTGALKAVGDEFGLSLSGGKDLAASLSKLSEKEYTKVVNELRHGHDIDGNIMNELDRIRQLSKGASGSLGDQAKALDDMSETGKMAMKMTSIMGKKLHEYSLIQLMGFEEMKGISGTELKSLQNMSREMHGSWETMKEMAADAKTFGIADGEMAEELNKKQKSLLDTYGAAVDEQGKIRKATIDTATGQILLGDEIKNLQEFMVKFNDTSLSTQKMEKDMLTKDQIFAQQIIRNTEPLSKILDITIQGWLMKIHDLLSPVGDILMSMIDLLGYLPGVPDDIGKEIKHVMEGQKRQAEIMEEAGIAISESRKGLEEISEAKKQTKTRLKEMDEAEDSGEGWFVMDFERQGMENMLAELEKREGQLTTTLAIGQKTRQVAGGLSPESFSPGGTRGPDAMMKLMAHSAKVRKETGYDAIDPGDIAEEIGLTNERLADNLKSTEVFSKEARVKYAADKIAETEQKTRDEKLIEKTPTAEDVAQAMTREQKREQIKGVLTQLGYSQSQIKNMGAGKQRRTAESGLAGGRFSALDADTKESVRTMAIYGGLKAPKGGAPAAEPADFILTDSGRLIQPNSKDTIMGMKPGGPLAAALAGGGKGASINITIVESHNTEKTYATVKRALRDGGLI